ncbi:hypothetical protein L1049_017480 [Liquidambar formosana]|uniref:Uncharacterized protein n=1 Tax=Liquidambar formosana TaxID=63359 RepID=A0AAP0S8J9_LIQFO
MYPSSQLIGPPEIYCAANDDDGDTTIKTVQPQPQNLRLSGKPRFGFTENNSLTYVATGNPCLDFFFHIVPNTPPDSLTERLQLAWYHDPITALKLICNLRGVRGTGKSDKEGFYTSALWLHNHHPKTLACNARVFAEFGYFKDLLEILYRILEGPNVRDEEKKEWAARKAIKGRGHVRKRFFLGKKLERKLEGKNKVKPSMPKQQRRLAYEAKAKAEKEQARALRKERVTAKAKKGFERYIRDPVYRFLHDQISEMFAEVLKADLGFLNSGEICRISLASKWCPSIDSSYDKATLICENIARRVFPRECDQEYQGIEEAHYVYRIRDRLRKQLLVPLHKALELPEVYMSSNQWETLPYNRVASVAMKNYKTHFLKHDNKRFQGYLDDVKSGNAKIAAGALLPHDIIASLKDADGGKVAELQWARMVDDVAKKGKLKNCIAVCDVSGSMNGTPMEVCVALGLLISELSEDPWKGKVITFSKNPQLHKVEGDSLLSKTQFIKRMDWGGKTDFQKVFDRILQVAVNGNLSEDQMIKRVFVFSDMEFDRASGHWGNHWYGCWSNSGLDLGSQSRRRKGWETDYEVIKRKFNEKGFNKVPEIVFWNLRDSSATPVAADESGVALVSGFSKNLVTLFLDNGGLINPEVVMQTAIAGELYQKLIIYD